MTTKAAAHPHHAPAHHEKPAAKAVESDVKPVVKAKKGPWAGDPVSLNIGTKDDPQPRHAIVTRSRDDDMLNLAVLLDGHEDRERAKALNGRLDVQGLLGYVAGATEGDGTLQWRRGRDSD